MNPITKLTQTYSATAILAMVCLISTLFGAAGWLISDQYEVTKIIVYLVSIGIAVEGLLVSIETRIFGPRP